MTPRTFLSVLLVVCMIMAVFGLFVGFGSMQHTDCLHMHDRAAFCALPLEHIGHWQTAFSGITGAIVVVVFVLIYTAMPTTTHETGAHLRRLSAREHVQSRFFQELFASGILNPKVP